MDEALPGEVFCVAFGLGRMVDQPFVLGQSEGGMWTFDRGVVCVIIPVTLFVGVVKALLWANVFTGRIECEVLTTLPPKFKAF